MGVSEDELITFIKETQRDMYLLAFSYVKQRDAALDIVQESILAALKSRNKLKEPQYLKTWFYRIVVNQSMNFLNKNRKYCYLELEKIEQRVQDEQGNFMDLYDAIDLLQPMEKSIIILRFFEDLTIEQVAGVLDMNVNTTKSKLYQTLKKLKGIMKEDEMSGLRT